MTNADLDWDAYGRDVLAGKIVVCKWVRKAVERHYRDLETGAARGLIFSEAHGRHVLAFFDFLKHSKDKWAGTRFELSRWQAFWLAVLFGWLRADGTRRFRKAYWEIARKNGKSTLLSGVGLYLLIGDGIAGAEVYTAATKLDQAKIVHEEAKRMVLQSAELRKHLQIVKNDILLPGTANTYKPLGADALTQDGLNPHGAILDELHAHPSRALWDVIESATGSRSQPLMFAITTAGFNIENSICIEQRNYVRRILEEAIDDDAYFGVIYTLDGYDGGEDDEKDDWTDPKHWIKANPNLGLSVFQDNLAESVRVAQNEPSAQANVLTKRFNVWVKASHLWMAMDRWKACGRAYTLEDLQDIVAVYGGLDLASTSDLCSLGLQFILEDGSRALWGKHYLPEDVALDSENPNHRLYMMWKAQGWLTITPGNVTDYAFIKSDAAKLLERFPIEEIAFDRWNSSQLVTDLMNDGANMVAFGQGYASMSPAMKEFERLIKGKQLMHPNDPVMTWAMSNVVASKDPAGNIKPDKQKSANKIDPAVAQIMAAGRASLAKIEPVIKTAFVGL